MCNRRKKNSLSISYLKVPLSTSYEIIDESDENI